MIRQKVLLTYYSQSFAQLFSFVTGIIVARFAGPTIMGTVAFGLAFVSMFSFIIDLGLDTAHIKLLSGGEDAGECISTFIMLKAAAITLFLLVITANYFLQTKIFHLKFETSAHKWVILISILTVVVEGIITIPKATFIARTERTKIDIPAMLRVVLSKSVRVVVAVLGLGAIALALQNLVVMALFIPVYYWLFKNIPQAKFNKKLAIKYLQIALPMIIILMTGDIYNYIDKVLLQYLASTREVGFFSVGEALSSPIKLFGSAVSALFFPMFSQLFSEDKNNQIIDLVAKFDRFLFLFVFPLVVLFMIYAPTFVSILLGKKYLASIQVISISALTMFVYILQLPYGNMIIALGKFKQTIIIQAVNLLFFVILIIAFVSKKYLFLGATGNAIAGLLSIIIQFILTFWVMKKYLNKMHLFYQHNIAIAYIIIFSVLFFIYKYIASKHLNILLYLYPILFVLILFGLMSFLKIITKKDWEDFLKLFKLKDIYLYIKSELKS